MISKFYIENFRSIEKAEIDLGKITVLTGANNSGKSSVIYAMLVLRNFLANPNQSIDNLLVPGQMNLGGFKESIYRKNTGLDIELGYETRYKDLKNDLPKVNFFSNTLNSTYKLLFNENSASVILKSTDPFEFEFKNNIVLPYPVNKNETFTISAGDNLIEIVWNGLAYTSLKTSQPEMTGFNDKRAIDSKILASLDLATTWATDYYKNLDFVPLRRGVSKAFFSTVPLSTYQYNEDEIATLLAVDRDLEGKVSSYLERFVDKTFSVRFTPGTGNFYLQIRDRLTGFITDLVNEGLGINQLIILLTKIFHHKYGVICIDEPEIHLHPSYIHKMVDIMIEATDSEHKQFVLSSHSEHLVSSLLNKVAEGKLNKDDLKIYYLTKDGLKTKFELQPVNEKGQIEGGLKSFYESELNLAKDFFKTND